MKFIIFLTIALFAVTVTTFVKSETNIDEIPVSFELDFAVGDGIVQQLIKFIESLITKTQHILLNLLTTLETLIKNISNNIQNIIDESKSIIETTTNTTLEKLKELAEKNEIAQDCVENARPQLEVAIAEYGLGIQICQDFAIEEVQSIRKEIEQHIDAIRDNIDALEDIVSDCLESTANPLKLIQCISKKTDEIKNQIFILINNVKNAITAGPNRALEIISNTKICILNENEKFRLTLEKIVQNIEKCIENGN